LDGGFGRAAPDPAAGILQSIRIGRDDLIAPHKDQLRCKPIRV
jgi:hypothetical protein